MKDSRGRPLDGIRGHLRDLVLPRYREGAGVLSMTRSSLIGYGTIGVALGLILMPLGAEIFGRMLVANGFDPQGASFNWNPALVSLHLFADVFTGLAYVAISVALIYLAYKVGEDLPFLWAFVAFGLFIVACGMTHFVAAWTLWAPAYWLAGGVKFATAVVSAATAVTVPPLVPKVLALVQAARLSERRRVRLEEANRELAALNARLSELDRLKSQFFSNVSHELRTPLALILGPVARLQADGGIADEQRRELEVVNRNARALLKHVNDLLDLSKLEFDGMGLTYARVDLAQLARLVAAYFESLARDRHMTLTVDAPAPVLADADPEKIERVLLNLLSNAFRFTPDGGRVTCSVRTAGAGVAIAVRDTGPGVKPELRAAVFERFRQGEDGATRRFGGTGLGLSIAKELVELHGGTITVDDAPGGGALFTVELPLSAPAGANVRPAAAPIGIPEVAHQTLAELRPASDEAADVARDGDGDGTAARPLVLVVEDNPDMRRFLVDALACDYRVAAAPDGRRGLERALALRPDLILSDVMLPEMSGDQLVRAARARSELETVPIVLLTARSDLDLRVQLLRDGAQDYLVKPFAVEELRARVGNQIAMKRARDVLQQELAGRSGDVAALAGELSARNGELKRALAARDEFLAVAAHELKTPLAVLRGFAQLALRQVGRDGALDQQRARHTLAVIDERSDKLDRLVIRLLDVSRIDAGRLALERQVADVARIVAEVVAAAQAMSTGHTLVLDAPPEVTALVDPLRLEQVVMNLVDNAIKYSPDGGPIDVSVSCPSPDAVQIAVTDRGIGIPPERRDRIFDRFFQAHTKDHRSGIGLGLYISRQIIELHGGTLTAEFPPEGGTRFVVTLPTEPGHIAHAPNGSEGRSAGGPGGA
ncbi:MAG: ATP-binding protein [Chloroflexota bacterium]|nr:ATP-binding protein [Chloroflexota bacterium]